MESRAESGKLLKFKKKKKVFVYFDLEVFAAYLITGTILGIGTLVAVSFSDEDVSRIRMTGLLVPITLTFRVSHTVERASTYRGLRGFVGSVFNP